MTASIFEQLQDVTGLNAAELESHLISYVVEAIRRMSGSTRSENRTWTLASGPACSRRLVASYDSASRSTELYLEISYALFEGDQRFFVERAGTISPARLNVYLAPLVSQALDRLNNWTPSLEYI